MNKLYRIAEIAGAVCYYVLLALMVTSAVLGDADRTILCAVLATLCKLERETGNGHGDRRGIDAIIREVLKGNSSAAVVRKEHPPASASSAKEPPAPGHAERYKPGGVIAKQGFEPADNFLPDCPKVCANCKYWQSELFAWGMTSYCRFDGEATKAGDLCKWNKT